MSRLERLVSLLDTGSSSYIRGVAAEQLADVQKAHPEELSSLLGRVVPFLRSPKWDTRVAAAKAIGLIAANVSWSPDASANGEVKIESDGIDEEDLSPDAKLLTFDKLDINAVIEKGQPLLGSAGKEYDAAVLSMGSAERLRMQKQALKKKIGLDFLEDDDDDDILDVDLLPSRKPSIKQEIKEEPDSPVPAAEVAPVNARMRALAKRKAKFGGGAPSKLRALDKTQSISSSSASPSAKEEEDGKVVVQHRDKNAEFADIYAVKDPRSWPFEVLTTSLMLDMFEPQWETRHGALLGLREIVKAQGAKAGMRVGVHDNGQRNVEWLEDLACRLCCVLALDRFADYVADQVVAPVRESCAQALGVLLVFLPEDTAINTFNAQVQLVMGSYVWAACHGGMLALQYLVSVRPELVNPPAVFAKLVHCVFKGLESHNDDDVQAISAAVLLPVAAQFVEQRPRQEISKLLDIIWSCLSDLRDELSISIGNVMDLLARLCSFDVVLEIIMDNMTTDSKRSFGQLVPYLHPFLRHSIIDVRKAVLRSLKTFLTLETSSKDWVNSLTLRLIFQNILLEQNSQVVDLSMELWDMLLDYLVKLAASSPDSVQPMLLEVFSPMLSLLMTPIGTARRSYKMNEALLLKPSGQTFSEAPPMTGKLQVNIDGPMINGDTLVVDPLIILRAKVNGSKAIGRLMAISAASKQCVNEVLSYESSPMSSQRLVLNIVLEECGNHLSDPAHLANLAEMTLPTLNALTNLGHPPLWRDINPILRAVRTQCQSLFSLMVSNGLPKSAVPFLPTPIEGDALPSHGADSKTNGNSHESGIFTLGLAEDLANNVFYSLRDKLDPEVQIKMADALEDGRKNLMSSISEARLTLDSRNISIRASAAAAFIALNRSNLPAKLNPIIRALMDSVKVEAAAILHERTANTLALLAQQLLVLNRDATASKIVKNCCAFLCVDVNEAPEFPADGGDQEHILSLRKDELRPEDISEVLRKERESHVAFIKRQGALMTLSKLCQTYGENLFVKLPEIKQQMFGVLSKNASADTATGQSLVDNMAVIRALLPYIHENLYNDVIDILPQLRDALFSPYSVIRFVSAKCFASVCKTIPTRGITFIVEHILPQAGDQTQLIRRQGTIECIYHLMMTMGEDVLPYIVFFIVPSLGRMSDSDQDIRMIAATTFASIIKLVPLESGVQDPPDIPKQLLEGRDKEREFIGQMMDASKVKPFDLPVQIKATLRKYQQDGVNWLAFLNKYHLHGILCDDMGLGKTLQTICMIASDHHLRAEDYKQTKSVDSRRLPSLIICPTTLTGHWVQEFGKYSPGMKVVACVGTPSQRQQLISTPAFKAADIIVTSYDTSRNDVNVLSKFDFNYCVLDEGHIIKNAQSKLSKAVKQYRSHHRLVLTGTPIQNNVLELWSLFDFLMPGFLGSEKSFNERFSKPIAASSSGKASPRDQEIAALALEALHKQVLPFTLRRLKEDVLDDLPPKIIQDYYCDLNDRQRKLYDFFTKSQRKQVANDLGKDDRAAKTHVFQALHYLRKLCNHPDFVQFTKEDLAKRWPLDATQSPKLMALQELLKDCGIGLDYVSASGVPEITSPHRALIFCQQKEMLDLVEKSLLKTRMPSVSYLRLDGSVPGPRRVEMVNQFNEDPSIDVLLLTTHVGGLGLNLTSADTVIFVEHDWNPMNDLQAMDRAHRIGQKRVVNVYRLITRSTLEERIMGVQEFKLNIASSVINQQNRGLMSMGTDQILDLFTESSEGQVESEPAQSKEDATTDKYTKDPAVAAGLGDLWDESEYAEEYNIDTFIKGLKSST